MSEKSIETISRISSDPIVRGLLDLMDYSNIHTYEKTNPITTSFHCLQTADFISQIAPMLNIEEGDTRDAVILGALLHDTGKSGVPVEVLHRSGKLSPAENLFLHNHPTKGAILIREHINEYGYENSNFKPWQWDRAIAISALHHREKSKQDRCYPTQDELDQLVNDKVVSSRSLLLARKSGATKLVALCDVVSALMANRPYMLESHAQDNVELITKHELKLNKIDVNILRNLLNYAFKTDLQD